MWLTSGECSGRRGRERDGRGRESGEREKERESWFEEKKNEGRNEGEEEKNQGGLLVKPKRRRFGLFKTTSFCQVTDSNLTDADDKSSVRVANDASFCSDGERLVVSSKRHVASFL